MYREEEACLLEGERRRLYDVHMACEWTNRCRNGIGMYVYTCEEIKNWHVGRMALVQIRSFHHLIPSSIASCEKERPWERKGKSSSVRRI